MRDCPPSRDAGSGVTWIVGGSIGSNMPCSAATWSTVERGDAPAKSNRAAVSHEIAKLNVVESRPGE
jgi:hypothetical protein